MYFPNFLARELNRKSAEEEAEWGEFDEGHFLRLVEEFELL